MPLAYPFIWWHVNTDALSDNMVFTQGPTAHLRSLATGVRIGTISHSSGSTAPLSGGDVKTYRWPLKNPMSQCVCDQFASLIVSFADLKARCGACNKLAPFLDEVAYDPQTWISVHRCRECHSLWAKEYPFGEAHGGGPPCYYSIRTSDPDAWLLQNNGITHGIRERHEDLAFLASLGEEISPDTCRKAECAHKRIALSVFCRSHHFEMIKGRRRPEP